MKTINLLYRAGETVTGYQHDFIKMLLEDDKIHKIVVVSRSNDIPCENDKVIEYKSSVCWKHTYRFMSEYKSAAPFSRSMLETIKKYEPMALSITRRDTNFDIYTVEEARDEYYTSLKFWYGVIIEHKISHICFSYVPHTTHEFSIYVMAKALQIPMLLFTITTIPHVFVYGNSLSKIGDGIRDTYLNAAKGDLGRTENIFIRKYLDRMLYNNQNYKFDLIDHKNIPIKKSADEYFRFVRLHTLGLKVIHQIKSILQRDKIEIKLGAKELEKTIKAYASMKRQYSLKYYNKIAITPEYIKPYVYYPMHMQPESTVTPGGGIYENQLFAIELLAAAAKANGIELLVKEHFVQPKRDKLFYDTLQEMDNVKLVKTGEPSDKLIKNCVAVASLTGSCILEGILKGKPVLVFGEIYYWKGLPGAYEINSVEQCAEILASVKENADSLIDYDGLERYFDAVGKNCVRDFSFFPQKEELEELTIEDAIKDKYDVLKEFLSQNSFEKSSLD